MEIDIDSIQAYFNDPVAGDALLFTPFDDELKQLIQEVDESFDFPKEKNAEKGRRLEMLANYLLEHIKCLDVKHDLRTESNQIDQKVTLTGLAGFSPFLKEIGLNFIAECKNQRSTVNVGQVQKVGDLMQEHDVSFAVFFSKEKIAGKGWKDAEGKRKKLYCRNKSAIISFTFKELVDIEEKNLNFVTEMREKYEQLKFEINLDEVSVDEPDWHDDNERIKGVLSILERKGILTQQELTEKLQLIN